MVRMRLLDEVDERMLANMLTRRPDESEESWNRRCSDALARAARSGELTEVRRIKRKEVDMYGRLIDEGGKTALHWLLEIGWVLD